MSTLASTGLSGARALRCCEQAPLRYQLAVTAVMGALAAEIANVRTYELLESSVILALGGQKVTRETDFERLLRKPFKTPGGSDFEKLIQKPYRPPVPRIQRITTGQALPLGSILLLTGTALSSLVRQMAALETMTAVLHVLDNVQPAKFDCERCIRQALWRQNRPQKKESAKIRRRI